MNKIHFKKKYTNLFIRKNTEINIKSNNKINNDMNNYIYLRKNKCSINNKSEFKRKKNIKEKNI